MRTACVTYNRHGKNHCTQHRVEFDTLYNVVFDEIKELAKETVDTIEVAEDVANAYEKEKREQKEVLERNIAKAEDRLQVLERMTLKAYEDLMANILPEDMFNRMVENANSETKSLKKQIEHDKKKLAQNDSEEGNARKWIDLIKDYTDITELDAEMLNRVVNKIVVHEDITANGDRNITMEIHYNFRPENESKIYNLSDVAETASVAKAM